MSRDVDLRKKRKALRKLRKAAELAAQGLGPPLSDWEQQFLEEVEERIETYGSAFADPDKGARDEALSALQAQKLREIDRKARGKSPTGFKRRKPITGPRSEHLDNSPEEDDPADIATSGPSRLSAVPRAEATPDQKETRPRRRPNLRLVKSDRDES